MTIGSVQQICQTVLCKAIEVSEMLYDLIGRIVSAVLSFFLDAAQRIHDMFFSVHATFVIEDRRWFHFNHPRNIEIHDQDVDLNALREALRIGIEPQGGISSRMTPADFSALCEEYPINLRILRNGHIIRNVQIQEISQKQAILDEEKERVARQEGEDTARAIDAEFDFPQQRETIGIWAMSWAAARTPKIDPQHSYFEIFQEAFRLKDSITDGILENGDYTSFSVSRESYMGEPHFAYMIKSLIGFQELAREDCRDLMRKLDNEYPSFEENFAYRFARNLSKIFCYPTGQFEEGRVVMDIRDKLPIGIGAPMAAFRAAQQRGRILEFFLNTFNNTDICFDARVSKFQDFQFNLENPHLDDFTIQIRNNHTTDEKIYECYRVFLNRAMYAQAVALNPENPDPIYETLKYNGGDRDLLFREYCTKDKFAQFLIDQANPIRDIQGAVGLQVPMIAFQPDWNGWIPTGLKLVPLNQIPEGSRAVGSTVGVQDPGDFMATLLIVEGRDHNQNARYFLTFSRNRPPLHHHQFHPRIEYNRAWMGLQEDEIDPAEFRLNGYRQGQIFLIKDPAIYPARIYAIQGDQAVLDFGGNPIVRDRWEAVLDNETYWSP